MREYYYFPCIDLPVNPKGWFALFFGGDTIIGRNGTGKSSYLYAIEFFYDLSTSVNADDFFNRDTSVPIDIRITFSDLKPEEKNDFLSFMKNELLSVTKRFNGEGKSGKFYAATPQIPQFSEIRAISGGKREKINAWNTLIDSVNNCY